MPGDLYNLNSAYGSEAELRGCIRALQGAGMKVLGDAVLNHRCAQRQDEHGVWNLYGGRMAWDQRAIVGERCRRGWVRLAWPGLGCIRPPSAPLAPAPQEACSSLLPAVKGKHCCCGL